MYLSVAQRGMVIAHHPLCSIALSKNDKASVKHACTVNTKISLRGLD